MKLKGELAELLVTTAPQLYRQYVLNDQGKPVLYAELLKALYGTLKTALLFYKKLRRTMDDYGFIVNQYNSCVANKIINDKQFIIIWHVDDLKLSHEKESVVSERIECFRKKFQDEEIGKIKISRGKTHKFLWINFDFRIPGSVVISMKDYVKDMIKTFPEEVVKTTATPAAEHLFKIREEVDKLDEKLASLYHTIAAKGLFLCKRSKGDILTTIAFLTTRVKNPDMYDWKKVKRLIQYLKGTVHLTLTLSCGKCNIIKWYIDAFHGVHDD